MALTEELNRQYQQQQNGLLNITAQEYYFKTLRPALVEFNKTYHTDRELNRTIVEVINHADSAAANKDYINLSESYINLLSGVQAKSYMISGPLRYGSDEEKKAVTELIAKFNDLSMILKYEKPEEKKKPEIRERLNYQPSNDGVGGYNLDDLSNRGPRENKERIPNQINEAPKYAY